MSPSITLSRNMSQNIRPILAAIRAVPVPARPYGAPEPPPPAPPFVTMSRQPGAGAWTLAREFVDAMNAADPSGAPWTCWDRELVEKVAADHHFSARLIESLDEGDHSWITDLFSGSSMAQHPEEAGIYRRVVQTMRALAQAGHVVIVGRGGAFATRDMEGGIHVRLIAPRERRIRYIAQSMNKSHAQAAQWVAQQEKKRAAFYKHFWPNESLEPEKFTVTINTARLDAGGVIAILTALVKQPAGKGAVP